MMMAKVTVFVIPEHILGTKSNGNVFTLRCHCFTQTCEVASLLIPILKMITLRYSMVNKPQHHTAVKCQKREWIIEAASSFISAHLPLFWPGAGAAQLEATLALTW